MRADVGRGVPGKELGLEGGAHLGGVGELAEY